MNQNFVIECAVLEGIVNRNCFISLPQRWITSFIKSCLVPTFMIKSASTTANIITNWSGHLHSDGYNIIYINNVLLKINGFKEGEEVYISQIETPSSCLTVFAELNRVDDWDNLIANYEIIQASMLDQVRVIKAEQIIPLWLEGGCLVLIKIKSFADSYSLVHILANDTIINIAPPKTHFNQVSISSNKPLPPKRTTKEIPMLSELDVFHLVSTSFKRSLSHSYGNIFPQKSYIYEILTYRSFPKKINDIIIKLLKCHPSLVIISKSIVTNSKFESSNWFLTNIERIKIDHINSEKSKSDKSAEESIAVCLAIVWENFSSEKDLPINITHTIKKMLSNTSCMLCESLKNKLQLSFSDLIQLDSENINISYEKSAIDFCPISDMQISNHELINSVRTFIKTLCNSCPLVLNDTAVVNVPFTDLEVQIYFSLRNKNASFIDNVSCSLVSLNVISKPINLMASELVVDCDVKPITNRKKIILYEDFLFNLLLKITKSLPMCSLKSQFIILEGDERSGKTRLAYDILKYFEESSIYCKINRVKLMKGKKADTIKRTLTKDVHDCLLNQPSVLILDDLDYLIPSHLSGNQEEGPLFEYIAQVSVVVKNIISQLVNTLSLDKSKEMYKLEFIIVATCKSRSDINSILSVPNGRNLFPIRLKIPSLNFEEKLKFLFNCITHFSTIEEGKKQINRINFDISTDHIKGTIHALGLSEIISLSRRILTEARIRCEKKDISICEKDFIKACKDMIPLSIKDMNKANKKCEKYVIGGLHLTQKIMKQSILWPLRHPKLFSQIGLNVRNGILLYGPPGCGKTLLANSIASSCNLNFIFVKGPELLSKFVGQSEKSVRDIFIRGRNAKPCILFFDEFDALAPRRGHDNTGVTDRVVNQLLTQMDGVEGNDGVFILAATSRPDLIDPALLRPGRLDKPLYCPIPDESERAEIFEALSAHLSLAEKIDWADLAHLTNQLTGADIKGIFSTAQVIAAQEILGKNLYDDLTQLEAPNFRTKYDQSFQNKKNVEYCSKIYIKKKHIMEAINSTTRSISSKEIKKYNAIYRKFGVQKNVQQVDCDLPGMRYTLA